MHIMAILAVLIVSIAHFGFLALEMFFWTKPLGMRIFNNTPEFAQASSKLAANQGLYNGFLAAGLLWSVFPIGADGSGKAIATFFLICVIVAGIYGAKTVSMRILRVQALPAAIALLLVWFL